MSAKIKKDSYKKKINRNGSRAKIKYLNIKRLKDIKTKKSGNIKYVSKKIHVGNGRYKSPIASKEINKQKDNRTRTQILLGNISSNAKDIFREKGDNRQPDMGIQAVIYSSDKVDAAADVVYSSKRVIHAVRGAKNVINTVREKGHIDKVLLKKLVVKSAKSRLRTAKNINMQISSRFQSEDTDLGIRSFAETEKEVRKTYDAAIAIKHTSSDISNAIKTVNSRKIKSSEHIKNKYYDEKMKRFKGYKKNTQNNGKAKVDQRVKANTRNKAGSYGPKKIKTSRSAVSRAANQGSVTFSRISKNVIEVAKKAVTFFLPGKKTVIVLLVCAVAFFLLLNSLSSGVIISLSQQYFMTGDDIAQKYQEKVEFLDSKLEKEISELADDDRYDDVDVIYIGDIQGIYTNFQEIFAAAAVKYEQDLTFSAKEESFVEEIYEKLYSIEVSSEIYQVTDSNGEEVDRKRKIITIYSYDMESVMSKLGFDDEQKSWTRRLVSGFGEQFPEFAQQYGELTEEEIRELMENAPKLSSSRQQKLYDTALSIVGKVKYFWGGKSAAGWNDDWGKKTKVTAEGSDTTGTYRPFGLDCSGYVDWVYKTAGIGTMLSGGGTAYQFGQSYPVKVDDLQVGDLAFLQMPNSSGINHVGIYIGKDKDNNNLYAHCEWGTGVTINSFKGFKYFRRVVNFEE